VVTVAAPPTQPAAAARAFGFVEGFGQQVIDALQLRAVASKN
jgi:hypothetical protein